MPFHWLGPLGRVNLVVVIFVCCMLHFVCPSEHCRVSWRPLAKEHIPNIGLWWQNYQKGGPFLHLGVHFSEIAKTFSLYRPSKCPKFYTNRILGEQNWCQKVRKPCQNLNCNKITYLIKYSLTIQFWI